MSRAQTVRYVLHAKRTSAAGGRVEAYWLRWRGLPQGRSNQRCPPSPALRPLLIRRPRWILNSAAVCVCACVCEGAMQRPNHRAVHTGSPRGKERTLMEVSRTGLILLLADWLEAAVGFPAGEETLARLLCCLSPSPSPHPPCFWLQCHFCLDESHFRLSVALYLICRWIFSRILQQRLRQKRGGKISWLFVGASI